MGKYIRLLRLQDQYVEFSAAMTAGILIHSRDWYVFWWALAAVFLTIPVYIVNEIIDGRDVDRLSWNSSVHMRPADRLDKRITLLLFGVLSLIGLYWSYRLGLFWWGLAIWIVGMSYSLDPIRLKRRFILDLVTQVGSFWVVFLALAWGKADATFLLVFLIVISVVICSMLLPYQIADYEADKKAGFSNTHVILGIQRSLWLGLILAILSTGMYFLYEMPRWALWLLPMVLLSPSVVALYIRWLRMSPMSKLMRDIRYWIQIYKPVTQLLAVYIFLVWLFL